MLRPLVRLLIPSWRFFDDVGTVPHLEYRVEKDGAASAWFPVLEVLHERKSSLFVNPEGLLHLAFKSVVERAVSERNEGQTSSVTEELLRRIVRRRIPQHKGARGQYRILLMNPLVSLEAEPFFESDWFGET